MNEPEKIIEGDVDLCDLHLTELPSFLKGVEVRGSFNCSHNKLRSLKNSPRVVRKNFFCLHNLLQTLEGGPEIVGWDFSCRHNQLRSLEGAPKSVGYDFYCWYNAVPFTCEDVWAVCKVQGRVYPQEIIQ